MALALGEDRDQHVGAGDLFAAGRLHMDHGALDDALEAGGRLGILGTLGDEIFQFRFQIGGEAAAQLVEIDIAGAHHRGGIGIVDQREQQMLERRIFVVALIGERERTMKRLFQAARETWHSLVLRVPVVWPPPGGYFFSMTHCRGW